MLEEREKVATEELLEQKEQLEDANQQQARGVVLKLVAGEQDLQQLVKAGANQQPARDLVLKLVVKGLEKEESSHPE